MCQMVSSIDKDDPCHRFVPLFLLHLIQVRIAWNCQIYKMSLQGLFCTESEKMKFSTRCVAKRILKGHMIK